MNYALASFLETTPLAENMASRVKELKKALFSSIQSNLEIIGFNNILLNRYEKISLGPNKVE